MFDKSTKQVMLTTEFAIWNYKMLTIRKNGGASVVSLPRSVLKALGVDNGSQLSYTVHGNTLSLTPVEKEKTLEELFAGVDDGEYADVIYKKLQA